ncbi:MAG: protein jag [Clostridiales bacterium]|jgi:spoIIIJ-associated protein|nr:protein jag [Clostridiales bacterium]HOB63762.1 RNA-binding cell elongation regulator Jag/EloR [Clostridia bacterium]HOK82062.1 RNA-binding cell elongation regulator Jag/EloR [Clostridia bacterium]HOL61292.1 RNA-binding cell elongation regulator Jag/EloR [Clostridia bacterium]HPO53643.1 RNA-binding cell elongation regulator Jag/EloR [Clostridia bacterium]
MKDKTPMEFKGATVDEAIALGLKELGLTESQVEVEVKSYGGIFTKACVAITPKAEPAAAETEEPEFDEDAKTTAASADVEAARAECEDFVKNVIQRMGVKCDVTSDTLNNEVNIYINGDDAGQVIGYRGEVLDSIQYFALIIANRGGRGFIRAQVDAGNYRKRRKDTLANLARRLAQKTVKSGRRTALEPMNPFERRVIHTTLAGDKDVTTQSEGEGKYRHVVIIPNNERNNSYGKSSDFRRNGPARTRSFGYNKRRF